MSRICLFFVLVSLISCQRKSMVCPPGCCETEVSSTKECPPNCCTDYPLVHTVYFDVDSEHQQTLIEACKKMQEIDQVKYLMVGSFENLGDERALDNYDVTMQMHFADQEAYRMYQEHPLHLRLKKTASKILNSKPATHDFMLSK